MDRREALRKGIGTPPCLEASTDTVPDLLAFVQQCEDAMARWADGVGTVEIESHPTIRGVKCGRPIRYRMRLERVWPW